MPKMAKYQRRQPGFVDVLCLSITKNTVKDKEDLKANLSLTAETCMAVLQRWYSTSTALGWYRCTAAVTAVICAIRQYRSVVRCSNFFRVSRFMR